MTRSIKALQRESNDVTASLITAMRKFIRKNSEGMAYCHYSLRSKSKR